MAKQAGSPTTQPTHDQIAAKAHAIYLESGCKPGRDLENWLKAEAALTKAASTGNAEPKTSPRVPTKTSRPGMTART